MPFLLRLLRQKIMKTSEFINKLFGKYLWGNLLAMAILALVLVVGVNVGIDLYTHHGEAIAIPDVRKMSEADAVHLLEEMGFVPVVSDTGYVKTLPPGTVLEQSPAAGLMVKSGRYVYLTVNASDTPTLTLPDIIDNCSYREAKAKLTSMGFKLGEPQYVPGEKDWVYGVKCRGVNISAGQRVSIEDVLIIEVGNGMRDANDSLYVTDPEYDYPDMSEVGGGSADDDDFEIIEDE